MYDSRDEAVRALKPKTACSARDIEESEGWGLQILETSEEASLTLVGFKKSLSLAHDSTSDLHRDFAKLTEKLANGSKVLLDFTGLVAIPTASIETLVSFNQNLRHKGSRMVLCCLEPAVRSSFFPGR